MKHQKKLALFALVLTISLILPQAVMAGSCGGGSYGSDGDSYSEEISE